MPDSLPATPGTATAIRLLIIEDFPTDAELAQRELRRGGIPTEMRRVESAAGLIEALASFRPHVILSDFSMPQLTGSDALAIARRHAPLTPFLFLSGTIGEETAIEALKQGAADYVLKTNMKRLAPAVRRALAEAEQRRAHAGAEARLRHLAYFDTLTGLPNRHLFVERLNERLREARGTPLAIVLADIERFRQINDTLGRTAGDQLLATVAQRLRGAVPEVALLARVAPDTFAFVTPENSATSVARALLNGPIAHHLGVPLRLGDMDVRATIKAGIALAPHDGQDPDLLLRNAEAALKSAKLLNRRMAFYEPEMNRRAVHRLTLETRLRTALEEHQFSLVFQPQVDLLDDRLSGFEALVRWNDPTRADPVSPARFVPVLEETGLIAEAGHWIMQTALRQHQAWRHAGLTVPRIAVNVSELQLREPDFVDRILAGTELDELTGLEVEITESSFLAEDADTIAKLVSLRAAGVAISVDDFGTGYSSLSKVAHLPIDSLKIDQSFVARMTGHRNDRAVVTAIVALAQALDLHIVAEGVETRAQAAELKTLGCDSAQGFLYAPPLSAAQAGALLRTDRLPILNAK